SSSLEHFKNDVRALSEMYRVLNPNGLVILTTDSFTYPLSNQLKILHTHISHVVNYYTYKSIKKKFEVAGFNIVRTKYLLNSSITSFFHKLD
ncbi:MAG: methyltransferase domain-containing protein, partial [Halobacteria archaeon]